MSHDHYLATPMAQAARTYSKHMSRDCYLLLCELTADTVNSVFTELLLDNALIKSVTLYGLYICRPTCT
jgi:hypothetical protein